MKAFDSFKLVYNEKYQTRSEALKERLKLKFDKRTKESLIKLWD